MANSIQLNSLTSSTTSMLRWDNPPDWTFNKLKLPSRPSILTEAAQPVNLNSSKPSRDSSLNQGNLTLMGNPDNLDGVSAMDSQAMEELEDKAGDNRADSNGEDKDNKANKEVNGVKDSLDNKDLANSLLNREDGDNSPVNKEPKVNGANSPANKELKVNGANNPVNKELKVNGVNNLELKEPKVNGVNNPVNKADKEHGDNPDNSHLNKVDKEHGDNPDNSHLNKADKDGDSSHLNKEDKEDGDSQLKNGDSHQNSYLNLVSLINYGVFLFFFELSIHKPANFASLILFIFFVLFNFNELFLVNQLLLDVIFFYLRINAVCALIFFPYHESIGLGQLIGS